MRLGPPKDNGSSLSVLTRQTEKLWAVLLSVGLHSQVASSRVFLLLGAYEESSPGTTITTAVLCSLRDCIQAPNCSKFAPELVPNEN
jgi:hypothetical protein